MDNVVAKKRVDWIDIAKGIAILLVIFGHSNTIHLRCLIYSFHVPLFFVCSGFTIRLAQTDSQFVKSAKKAFIRMMACATLFFFLENALHMILNTDTIPDIRTATEYFINRIIVFIVGSGEKLKIGSTVIDPIGMPWFLLALLWGRIIFDFLHLICRRPQIFCLMIVVLSILGVIAGHVLWLPMSLDISFAIQPFFLLGLLLRKINLKKRIWINSAAFLTTWLMLITVLLLLTDDYLELAIRHYPMFPICFLCAAGGSLFVISISIILAEHFGRQVYPLKIIGKHSLIMYCIHGFDSTFPFVSNMYTMTENDYINAGLRILVDCAIFALVMLLMSLYRRIKTKTQANRNV